MTTLVPMPMKLKAIRKKMMTWFATPSAATAPSDTWLTMNTSTVGTSMRSVCSTKIGHAIPRRESLAADGWVIGGGGGAYPDGAKVSQTVSAAESPCARRGKGPPWTP